MIVVPTTEDSCGAIHGLNLPHENDKSQRVNDRILGRRRGTEVCIHSGRALQRKIRSSADTDNWGHSVESLEL